MNTLSGFILVRAMAKEDYAWFTIALAALSTISVLADSGLGSAFSAVGGPLVSDTQRFASLARLVRRRRAVYCAVAGLIVLPITFGLLYANGARFVPSVLVLGLVALTAYLSTEAVVYATAHKLRSRIRPLMHTELAGSGVRLVLILAAAVLGIGVTIAVACSSIAEWARLFLLKRQSRDLATTEDHGTEVWSPRINSIVGHSLPIVVFYCIRGQIATFILSAFATTSQVADFGALTRFHVVFAVSALPLGHFVFPTISRCCDRVQLRKLILGTIVASSGLFAGLAAIGMLCSTLLLWLLGPVYTHLTLELNLYLAASALASCETTVWGIVNARGWVRHGWTHIPLAIAFMIIGAQWLHLENTASAIVFSALGSLAALFVGLALVARRIPTAR